MNFFWAKILIAIWLGINVLIVLCAFIKYIRTAQREDAKHRIAYEREMEREK
jgi:hypothetical protein